jgi:ADP-ribose pyrophosphatase YjhB (NUDIX family)
MSASRVIIFNPSGTHYLVGKESRFITNIKDISNEMKTFINILFRRKVSSFKGHNNKAEIRYYSKQLKVLYKNSEIINIIKKYSNSNNPRITFGDIKYIKVDNQIYSYTIPQFVLKNTPYSFPGGQPSANDTDISCGLRELYEETGINLKREPYDLNNLIDKNVYHGIYKIFYYILNDDEYTQAINDINEKNNDPHSELHDLRFITNQSRISTNAAKNLKRVHKYTRKLR